MAMNRQQLAREMHAMQEEYREEVPTHMETFVEQKHFYQS